MAHFDQTRTTQPGYGLGALSNLMNAFSAWNEARKTRRALAQLSDRELEDIGLVRGDIDRMDF